MWLDFKEIQYLLSLNFNFSTSSSNVSDNGQGCVRVELEDSVDFMVSVTLNSCEGLKNGESTTYVGACTV